MTVLTAQEQKRASLVKKGECGDVCGLRTPGAPQQAVAKGCGAAAPTSSALLGTIMWLPDESSLLPASLLHEALPELASCRRRLLQGKALS